MKIASADLTVKNMKRVRHATLPMVARLFGLSETEVSDTSASLLREIAPGIYTQLADDYYAAFRSIYQGFRSGIVSEGDQIRFTALLEQYRNIWQPEGASTPEYRVKNFIRGALGIWSLSDVASANRTTFGHVGHSLLRLHEDKGMRIMYDNLQRIDDVDRDARWNNPNWTGRPAIMQSRMMMLSQYLKSYFDVLGGVIYLCLADNVEVGNSTVLRAQDEEYLKSLFDNYDRMIQLGTDIKAQLEAVTVST